MCNRTAVHNQLLQHGFQAAWFGGLRIATTSSAAGATARIAVVVQTGCGFLSGGRRGASLEDREDCFGRATVALTRAIRHTYIVSPIDMAGMIGMAQTLAVYHYGYHTLKNCARPTAFENSRLTWVSVQDVVLNTLKDRPRNQVKHSQSSATFTHTSNKVSCSCRYGSCWCVTPWHKMMRSRQSASFC